MSRENNVLSDAPFRAREAWSRANDLLATGSSRTEKTIALRALHEPLAGKRRVTSWHPILERIVQMHLDLCVELNDFTSATSALDAYRRLTQNVNTASLNDIITRFVNNVTNKLILGKSTTSEKPDAAQQQDLSLEEALRCASYVDEDYREMIGRRKMMPQESRTWDAHRFSIDILQGNPKLLHLFLNSIQKGAVFCAEHRRKSDLRDLIRHTRKSVDRASRWLQKEEDVRRTFVATPETYHIIMDTWLKLFEVASSPKLVMWPEAYKIIEHMNFTMQEVFFGQPSKPHHLIAYSEAVVKVFGASTVGPHELYHAYALFFLWKRKARQGIIDTNLPNLVLLATLRIANVVERRPATSVTEKTSQQFTLTTRWMNLLALKYSPTWTSIVAEVQQIKPYCDVRVQKLSDILVQQYLTVEQYKNALDLIDELEGNIVDGDDYFKQIRENALTLLVSTILQSYASIRTETVAAMCRVPDFHQLEPVILKVAGARKEPIVIDEMRGIVTFHRRLMDHATATLSSMRCATLTICDTLYDGKDKSTLQKFIRDANEHGAAERQQILLRLELIEKRRIAHDTMIEAKRMEEHQKKLQKDVEEREQVVLKFAKERLAREEEKQKNVARQARMEAAKDILKRLETILNREFPEMREITDRRTLLDTMLARVQEAQLEMSEKAYHEVKRMDYFVRALREAEVSLLEARWEQTSKELESEFELRQQFRAEINAKNAVDTAETRERLMRMKEKSLAWQKEIIAAREVVVKEQTRKRAKEQKVADELAAGAAKGDE